MPIKVTITYATSLLPVKLVILIIAKHITIILDTHIKEPCHMLLTLSTEYLPSDYTLMCSIPDTDIDITEVTLNFWLEREKLQFITTHFYTIHNVCTRNYSCNTVKAHILPHSTLYIYASVTKH